MNTTTIEKHAPLLEDLRHHSQDQMTELRELLRAGIIGRPDLHHPGFYEVDGIENVYYVFRYPAGDKVLLVAAWQKRPRGKRRNEIFL